MKLLPTLTEAKAEAKRLLADMRMRFPEEKLSAAYEALAKAHGFRDWNTLRAKIVAASQ